MSQIEPGASSKLTVIIPVRDTAGAIQAEAKLLWRKRYELEDVELIVVDDGSPEADSRRVARVCGEIGARYFRLQTTDAPFSLSRARNRGISEAKAPLIYFEDLDFVSASDFYQRLIRAGESLQDIPFNFIAIPTLFLTDGASRKLLESTDFDRLLERYVAQIPFVNPDEPNELVDSFAPVGSNILVPRSLCFHVGLFDEFFNSWGGEDREFIFRLLYHNGRLLRPDKFQVTKRWKIHRTNAFEGWRALYRLHGDWARSCGLYAVHVYHPDNSWKTSYQRKANFRYCDDKIAAIHAGKVRLEPVRFGGEGEQHTVFVGRNPTFYNDDVMALLGSVSVVEMDQLASPEDFVERLLAERPTRIMFQNIYSNPWLESVWRLVREQDVRSYCVERGAFPGSIYFDPGGFCAESASYARGRWENSAPVDARAYVESLRSAEAALEPQGSADVGSVASLLNPGKRTVLVLLQSLTDATTKFFTEPLASYEEFLSICTGLVECGRFNVLVKNHPLNTSQPLSVGIDVSAVNIYDLFPISDACVTLNSGAGLLALGAGRSVVTLGTCFYAGRGLAQAASGLAGTIAALESAGEPDISSVDRFFGYLQNEFYSFADWKYGQRKQSEQTKMSLMSEVRYRELRIDGMTHQVHRGVHGRFQLIMDPYALDLFQRYRAPAGGKKDVDPGRSRSTGVETRGEPGSGSPRRKLRKLTRDPHAFFEDAKIPALWPLKHLFPKK